MIAGSLSAPLVGQLLFALELHNSSNPVLNCSKRYEGVWPANSPSTN